MVQMSRPGGPTSPGCQNDMLQQGAPKPAARKLSLALAAVLPLAALMIWVLIIH